MKKNRFKFILDIGIAVIFALLFSPEVTSLTFHEIAGIVLGAVLIVHVLINRKWIVGVSKKLFSKSIKGKTKLSYILNIILFIDMIMIIISGLLISEVVLPNFRYDITINWLPLHIVSSMLGLLIVGIHIGLHWKWIQQMASHFPKWEKPTFLRQLSPKLLSRILLVVGTLVMLPQVTKMVALTPAIVSDTPFGFEAREGNRQNVDEGKEYKERFANEQGGEFKEHRNSFSIIQLVGIIPVLMMYSAALFSIAFYTNLFASRSLNKRIKAS